MAYQWKAELKQKWGAVSAKRNGSGNARATIFRKHSLSSFSGSINSFLLDWRAKKEAVSMKGKENESIRAITINQSF